MQTATSPENESSGDDIGVGDDLTATSPQGSEEAKLFPSATPTSLVGRASAATPTHLGDGSLLATPSFSIDSVTDPRLQMAYQEAMATKRMTPLVKEELRLSILSRRLAKGADDINVEFTQPVSHSLTPQEQEKRARRRQQNRDAAQKFREKRKLMDKSLDEEVEVLMKRRRELEAEVARLTSEKEAMLLELCPHLISQAESLVLAEVGSGEVALPCSVGSASSPQPSTSSAYLGDVTSDWSCESSAGSSS